MRTSKNWADHHLSAYADPKVREENRRRQEAIDRQAAKARRLATLGKSALALVLMGILAAAGLAVGDYTGVVPLGIIPHRAQAQAQPQSVAEVPAQTPEPVAPTSRATDLPPGVAAELLSGVPHAHQQAPPESVAVPAPAPAEPAIAYDRERSDRRAHLDAGIALMAREQAECDRVIADQNLYLTMRPRPRQQPWNAAEALDELAIYLRGNPQLTSIQRADLQDKHDRWTAEVRNAKQRIAEQQAKRASLQARMDKAKAERDQLAVP